MKYISVSEFARKWDLPERTVRSYCQSGKMAGAFLTGKTWNIPDDAVLPAKKSLAILSVSPLLQRLREEKEMQLKGGIYHRTQIDFAYNSNKIEGSRLSKEQTRNIFETNTIGFIEGGTNVDDVIETVNHFRCVDMIIDNAANPMSESMIKALHSALKVGTSDSRKSWFKVGEYKMLPNEVGGHATCAPNEVPAAMRLLLKDYHQKKQRTFDDILEFHHRFETIHPFQDGNGRVGRLIMFKECLAGHIVPFIINDEIKHYYYRGLAEWPNIREYLRDTCLTAQDEYKALLSYFEIR